MLKIIDLAIEKKKIKWNVEQKANRSIKRIMRFKAYGSSRLSFLYIILISIRFGHLRQNALKLNI